MSPYYACAIDFPGYRRDHIQVDSINDVLKIRYKQFTGVIMVLAKPVSNFKIAGLASTVKRTVASKLHKIFLCDWFAKLVRAGKVIPRNNVQCLPF